MRILPGTWLIARDRNVRVAQECASLRVVEIFAFDRPRKVPSNDDFALRLAEEALGVKRFATKSAAASKFRREAIATSRFVAIYGPS